MKKIIFSSFALMLFSGCATTGTYQSLSSGQIGCSPDDITIEKSSLNPITGVMSWEATCKSKKYFCNASGAGYACKQAQ